MNSKSDAKTSLEQSNLNDEVSDETSICIEKKIVTSNCTNPPESHEHFQHFSYDSHRFDLEFVVRKLKWSFAVFCFITGVFYVVNASCFNYETRQYVFHNLKFLADWRILMILVGIYVTFAIKKSYEISNVSVLTQPFSLLRCHSLFNGFSIFR